MGVCEVVVSKVAPAWSFLCTSTGLLYRRHGRLACHTYGMEYKESLDWRVKLHGE